MDSTVKTNEQSTSMKMNWEFINLNKFDVILGGGGGEAKLLEE